ncbi:MAG: SprT-like domain-containing protein [Candidatus Kariarchaeaceae archaeon]|jgi:predicted SprT family Zn-dependent metalloprotease
MKSKTCRVPQEIKDRVDAEIRRCIEIAERKYERTFKFPTIKYNVRGTCGGYARDWANEIDFNSILLMENLDVFIEGQDSTVTHEFAHLVDQIVYPNQRRGRKRSVHGRTWKSVMRAFGIRDPQRCHSFDTTNSQVRRKARHVYSCNGCGATMTIGPVRHKKQQKLEIRTRVRGQIIIQKVNTVYWARGCGRHKHLGYTYVGQEAKPKPAPTAPRYPAWASEAKPKAPKPGTKLDYAVQVVRDNSNKDREFVITAIMRCCNMSFAGAQTYYYKAKKII